jgi:hypothetical protein
MEIGKEPLLFWLVFSKRMTILIYEQVKSSIPSDSFQNINY